MPNRDPHKMMVQEIEVMADRPYDLLKELLLEGDS